MKLIYKILLALILSIPLSVLSNPTLENKDLIKYSTIYGELSIMVGTFIKIDEKCKTDFIPASITSKLEVLFQKRTGYSYSEFGSIYGDPTETKELINRAYENMLSVTAGCKEETLNRIFKIVLRDKINPLMEKLGKGR